MALKLANNATSTLASGITNSATTLVVQTADAALFPTLAAGDWFPLTLVDAAGNREILRCTARSAATLTVVRAQEGTAAIAFATGSSVDLRLTKAALDYFEPVTGRLKTVQVFAASGTWTKPAGCTAVRVRVWGGGGGGGGANNVNFSAGGGGGAGGHSEEFIDSGLGATETVVVGAGGAGGGAAGLGGGTGGTTSFGAFLTAAGGGGGGSGGDVNSIGARGHPSTRFGATNVRRAGTNGVGSHGIGSGGLGAVGDAGTASAGDAGSAGLVVVEEFY